MTLSRKCTALCIVSFNVVPVDLPRAVLALTIRERLIEPRLHDSYGSSGCSPHGFVDSILPTCGVGLSLVYAVEEYDARVAVLPGMFDYPVEDLLRA